MDKPKVNQVVTRFAPSPTGFLHVGALRTALFAALVAKQNNGKFILRIEDTDRERLVKGAEENIKESLNWAGLDFDGPIRQSERLSVYKKYGLELKEKGLAYEDQGALRFRIIKGREIGFKDIIRGQISISSDTLEDFVLIKGDGYPTYNFANVIDDHEMNISHVIRGEEFIPSTPKHLLLYKAFGWSPPGFAHLPQVLGKDKTKLSKRHGAKSVLEYRDEGYLPATLLNFLALLGWHPKDDRELFTFDELVKEFKLEDVQSSPAVFDAEKLDWFNGQYLRKLSDKEIVEWARRAVPAHAEDAKLDDIARLTKERVFNFGGFLTSTAFFFSDPEINKNIIVKKADAEIVKKILNSAKEAVQNYEFSELEHVLRQEAEKIGVGTKIFFMTLRIAVTGSEISPPLIESMQILGKDELLKRLTSAIKILK